MRTVRSSANPLRLDDFVDDPVFAGASQHSADARRHAAHTASQMALVTSGPTRMRWAEHRTRPGRKQMIAAKSSIDADRRLVRGDSFLSKIDR